MGMLKKLIQKTLNNTVYVKSLEIGGNYIRDYESSYFIHPKKQVGDLSCCGYDSNNNDNYNLFFFRQVQDACAQVKADPNLANRTFNAIGFSQGSQFL